MHFCLIMQIKRGRHGVTVSWAEYTFNRVSKNSEGSVGSSNYML